MRLGGVFSVVTRHQALIQDWRFGAQSLNWEALNNSALDDKYSL